MHASGVGIVGCMTFGPSRSRGVEGVWLGGEKWAVRIERQPGFRSRFHRLLFGVLFRVWTRLPLHFECKCGMMRVSLESYASCGCIAGFGGYACIEEYG